METITEAKEFLRTEWHQGCKCPACGQMVKLYARPIHTVMAQALIRLYRLDEAQPNQYFHASEIIHGICETGTNDISKLRYWGLIVEKQKDSRETARRTSGYWAMTIKGRRFVLGLLSVPKYVYIFNKKSFGFSEDETITIREALGNKFNYSDLMGGSI